MNIDLFMTPQNDGGLVCADIFPAQMAGIIFDAQTRELTLEFADHATFHLNIPMEERHGAQILLAQRMLVGFVRDGMLMDATEVPLHYLNDPYGGEFGRNAAFPASSRAVRAFEQFLKRCSFAQALHRDDLGDESAARSVLKGADMQHLQLSPVLLRQMQMSAVPKQTPAQPMQQSGLGLGGGTARQVRPLTSRNEDGDKQGRE